MIPLNQNLNTLKRSGIRRYTNLAKTVQDCVMLTLGEPDFDTPEEIKAAALTSLFQNRTHYAPNQGIEDLRHEVAAFETIRAHLEDLNRTPLDYDLIVTGDLGQLGKDILLELGKRNRLNLGGKLADCGTMVFDPPTQDVHSGGSGCGCSAITLCGYLLNQLNEGKLRRILFCGTGALLSPTSTQQGLPIPGVCHGISIITGRE